MGFQTTEYYQPISTKCFISTNVPLTRHYCITFSNVSHSRYKKWNLTLIQIFFARFDLFEYELLTQLLKWMFHIFYNHLYLVEVQEMSHKNLKSDVNFFSFHVSYSCRECYVRSEPHSIIFQNFSNTFCNFCLYFLKRLHVPAPYLNVSRIFSRYFENILL